MTLTFDSLIFELGLCHVFRLVWSNHAKSLKWIRVTIPELRRLYCFPLHQLKLPIVTFWSKKVTLKCNLSNPQKSYPWREQRIMLYCAWGRVQGCDLLAWRRNEKRYSVAQKRMLLVPNNQKIVINRIKACQIRLHLFVKLKYELSTIIGIIYSMRDLLSVSYLDNCAWPANYRYASDTVNDVSAYFGISSP